MWHPTPDVYENLKNNAPESLYISVEKVETRWSVLPLSEVTVFVNAKVLSVYDSQSDLKKGDMITIIYKTVIFRPPGWVGPSAIPILDENKTYNAYLKKSDAGKIYVPAARGRSFE